MNHIVNFVTFKMNESTPALHESQIVNIEMTDKWGVHLLKCEMIEFGWGLDRSKLFHRFRIKETDSDKYPIGGEMLLPMDFNGHNCSFIFYPYYNEKPGIRSSTQLTYESSIKIVK